MDKNTTVVFPAPLVSTIEELGSFLHGEADAAGTWAHEPALRPRPDSIATTSPKAPANGQIASRAGTPSIAGRAKAE